MRGDGLKIAWLVWLFIALTGKADGTEDILRVHVLDVGQGDSIVVESPDGRVLVVDIGEDHLRSGKEADVLHQYLTEKLHKYVIDYLLITHYHEDHIGWPREVSPTGVFYLHRLPGFKIKKVIDRGLEIVSDSPLCERYKEWTKTAGIKREDIRFRTEGPTTLPQIDLGPDLHLDVIAFNGRYDKGKGAVAITSPEEQRQASEHVFSIVFVLHYRRFDMYFGGDICGFDSRPFYNIEGRFTHRLREVEVYKVSDHGSSVASRHELLEALMPEVSIVSCGRGYGMPTQEAVEKLLGYKDVRTGRPLGSDIYQTEGEDGYQAPGPFPISRKVQVITRGPIVIETDGRGSFYVLYRDERREYLLDELPPYRNN